MNLLSVPKGSRSARFSPPTVFLGIRAFSPVGHCLPLHGHTLQARAVRLLGPVPFLSKRELFSGQFVVVQVLQPVRLMPLLSAKYTPCSVQS